MSDRDSLVGLWDSGPFDYGAMESSRLGLLADGTGWGEWSSFGGGMELILLTWRCPRGGVLELAEHELISGSWEPARPGRIVTDRAPTPIRTTTPYGYEVTRERPPLGDGPVRALRLDRAFLFTSEYAFVPGEISGADVPVVVRGDG
jgi:hypothetical protein